MTVSEQPAISRWSTLRIAALALSAAQGAFYLYTWKYLIAHANPKGDGMELVATVPLTFLFLIFALPALIMSFGGRAPRTSAVLAVLGLICNALLWTEILSEFASHAPR